MVTGEPTHGMTKKACGLSASTRERRHGTPDPFLPNATLEL